MEEFNQMDMMEERSMLNLFWLGRIFSSLSWWKQLCWLSATPTAQLHKPMVSHTTRIRNIAPYEVETKCFIHFIKIHNFFV